MRDLDPKLWDNLGGFDVEMLKSTGKYVYKENQSKNAKENKDMTPAEIKRKKTIREENDKLL